MDGECLYSIGKEMVAQKMMLTCGLKQTEDVASGEYAVFSGTFCTLKLKQ